MNVQLTIWIYNCLPQMVKTMLDFWYFGHFTNCACLPVNLKAVLGRTHSLVWSKVLLTWSSMPLKWRVKIWLCQGNQTLPLVSINRWRNKHETNYIVKKSSIYTWLRCTMFTPPRRKHLYIYNDYDVDYVIWW